MLFGEHAVVYGYPCLVTAVSQRLRVSVRTTQDNSVTINAPQTKDTRFVEAAIKNAVDQLHIRHRGLLVETQNPFSGIYGFGSSSAVTVATIKALAGLFDIRMSKRQLFDIAYAAVMEVQGVGSGFDVAAASYGGTLYFVIGGKEIKEVPFLSSDDSVALVVGYSGVKSNTVDIVREVALRRKQSPEKIENIFRAITQIAYDARNAIIKKEWKKLGKLMDLNQEYLRDLKVSSKKLDELINAANWAGAYGAKLSGAGGGDCMIALVPRRKKSDVENALVKAGGQVVSAQPHEMGAMIQTTDDQDELFVVVDSNDNVIGYRTRHECHQDANLIHRTVGIIIYDNNGKVLLQKRSQTKDMGAGLWGLSCAGHMKKGQSGKDTVQREMQEELGVDLAVKFTDKFIVADEAETEMSYLFEAKSNGPFKPNSEEISDLKFFSPRELKLKTAKGEIQLTKCAYRSLQQAGVFE